MADSPISDMGLSTASDLLRGRLSGVIIGAEQSTLGQNASILVRGKKSINATSTAPLIVLDGVIFPGHIEDIDPQSIDQVSVLKDATSLAAYGSKAANGVIMITSKKGQEGKPTITFSTTQQFSRPTYVPKVLSPSDYIIYRNARQGKTSGFDDINFMTLMEDENYKNGVVTDWYDMCLQTGWTQNYNVNFSGRTRNSNYFVGLGHSNQKGTVVGDHFVRNNVSLNLSTKISKYMEAGVNMAYAQTLDDSNRASIRYDLYCLSPYGMATLPDGRLRYYTDGISGSRYNPLWPVEYGGEKENRYKNLNLGGYLSINFPWVEGLNFRINASYGQRNTENMSFRHENYYVALLGEDDFEGIGQNPEYFSLKDANGSISVRSHKDCSAVVAGGAFSLKGNADEDALLAITVDGIEGQIPFFNDGAQVKVNVADGILTGSALNTKLSECDRRNKVAYDDYKRFIDAFSALSEEEQIAQAAEWTPKYEAKLREYAKVLVGMVDENKDNLIPVAFIGPLPDLVAAMDNWNKEAGQKKLDELLAGNPRIAAHPVVINLKNRMAAGCLPA